jgi:hypothetical protein
MIDSAPSSTVTFGWSCDVRVPPPPHLLDHDTARRIAAQEAIAAGVVAAVLGALAIPPPEPEHRPRVIPPGWWNSSAQMADCSALGRVVVMACGIEGVALDYLARADQDHRASGVDALSWSVLLAHEAAHAVHCALIGVGAASAAILDPARRPGDEPEGFLDAVGIVHVAMTGAPLPAGFDRRRWPLGAPGLAGWLEAVAVSVLPYAVASEPVAKPSQADFLLAWGQEAYRDQVEGERMRAEAAAYWAERKEAWA